MRRICLVGLASLLAALPLSAQQGQQTKNRQLPGSVSTAALQKQVKQLLERVNELQEQVGELQATLHKIQGQTAARPSNDFGRLSSVQVELTGFENECSRLVQQDAVKTATLFGGAASPNPVDLAEGTALGAQECAVRLSKIVADLVEVLKGQ